MNTLQASALARTARAEFEGQYPGTYALARSDKGGLYYVQLVVKHGLGVYEKFDLYAPGELARVRAKLLRREVRI